jgi:hypothetical protein
MIVTDPYYFLPFWRNQLQNHLIKVSNDPNFLVDSLEYAIGNNDLILGLLPPSESTQRKKTEKLHQSIKKTIASLEDLHMLDQRFSNQGMSIKDLLDMATTALTRIDELLKSDFHPPPLADLANPITRKRKPHIRIIALLVCDWCKEQDLSLSPRFDVLSQDTWDGGDLSLAARITELCIWDYETQKLGPEKREAYIDTIIRTGRPRASLKSVMANVINEINSRPN